MRKDGKLRAAFNRIEKANKAWIIFKFDEPSSALDLEGVSGYFRSLRMSSHPLPALKSGDKKREKVGTRYLIDIK